MSEDEEENDDSAVVDCEHDTVVVDDCVGTVDLVVKELEDSADVDENVEVVVEMVTLSLPALAKGNFIFLTLITGFEDETSGADDIDIKGLDVVDVVNTPLLDPDKECKAK